MACRSRLQSVTGSLFFVRGSGLLMVDRETFVQVAPLLAIAGNALLTPPLQAGAQSAAIFDARLWEELAACEDAEVANAVDKLVKYLDGREETAAASREA